MFKRFAQKRWSALQCASFRAIKFEDVRVKIRNSIHGLTQVS